MSTEFDLLIRGGTVVDGTGRAPYVADVAVRDGKIAAVGPALGGAREEIEASGRLVTPGFVDVHTHYDGQAVWDERMQPSSWHGVTTAVMGNCGVGFAPVRPGDQQRLIELMEGVEDIPGAVLDEGLSWEWESFPEYLDALDRRRRDIDIAAQLPHGALRVYVMGERAARLEPATRSDNARMRELAEQAMRAGALGFSTSRTLNHRTLKGDPTPSLRASEDELMAIAMGMRDAGSGVLEYISDWNTPDPATEFQMVRRIVEKSGRPLSFSLAQRHAKPDGWRELLGMTEQAARDGLPIRAQVAPRPIGLLLSLQGSRHPFIETPTYRSLAGLPFEARLERLRAPATRAKVLAEFESMSTSDDPFMARAGNFAMMFPLDDPPQYEPQPEQAIAAQAARLGVSPAALAYDLLVENDGSRFLLTPFANFANGHLDVCGEMLQSPSTLLGLGDGGAHVSIISDASFTSYLLAHWGRDRQRGKLPIEALIRKLTRDNAKAVQLEDRGVVATGMKADLNVIDFERLAIALPKMTYDLPAGGRRLMQAANGYAATIVSGQVTYRDGRATNALPGKLIRGRQSVARQVGAITA